MRFLLAGDEGFEPSQTESESGVLPLHKSPMCRCAYRINHYIQKIEKVKPFFKNFLKIFATGFSAALRALQKRRVIPIYRAVCTFVTRMHFRSMYKQSNLFVGNGLVPFRGSIVTRIHLDMR